VRHEEAVFGDGRLGQHGHLLFRGGTFGERGNEERLAAPCARQL